MKWIGENIRDYVSRFRNNVEVTNIATSSATQGGKLNLISDDGAAMGDDHQLGRVGFWAAEDTGGTLREGASIRAFADAAWSASENGTRLEFYTMDGNNASELSLTLDSDKLATFAGAVTVTSDLIVNGDTVTFSSANADDPIVTIKNTSNDVNNMASLNFVKDRGAAATVGTNLAEIYFTGEDADQNAQEYGRILCEVDVATGGQESGALKLGVANHDGGNGYGLILTGGSADNEVDVTLGLGAASVVTIPGDIDLAGDIDVDGTLETDALTIGGTALTSVCSPVAGHSSIATVGTIGTGTWQGTAVASAYLDADTMHYSAQRQLTHHLIKDDIDTTKIYIGLQEVDAENTNTSNKNLPLLAPVAGKLLKVSIRASNDLSGVTLTWRLETRASSATTFGSPSVIGTQSGTGCTASSMTTYDFTSSLDSGTNAIAAGDQVLLSIQSDGATSDTTYLITCLWEWDLS